jgi:hypothetical protein
MPAAGMIGTFLKTAIVFLVCLALGDVVGVVACTIFDIAPIRGYSAALPYAIWFVLGVFTGFFAFGAAGIWASPAGDEKWMEQPYAVSLGTRIFLSALVVSVVIGFAFWRLSWSRGVVGEYYVPDSGPHTITYLVGALGAIWVGRLVLKPSPKA